MTIKLPTSYYIENDKLFKAKSIDLKPGVSVLVGCNGAGKTTFMQILKSHCRKQGIPTFTYNNLSDGGDMANSKLLMSDRLIEFAQNITSSEGENIINNFTNIVSKIGSFVATNRDKSKCLVVMLDAIDSGLSVDNIIEIKDFFNFVISNEPNNELYIIVAANNYEMANGEPCIDIANSKNIAFNSYEEYRNFIMQSREAKNKRYEKHKTKKSE